MLKSDTEYTMEVAAVTNEGRFRSKPAKIRTLKDEFNNAHRYSLYEPLSQSPPRVKRTETVSSLYSSATNLSSSRASMSSVGRRLFREGTHASRNVDMSTTVPIQLASGNLSNSRTLPALTRSLQPRAPESIRRRDVQRYRTEPISINQLQPQTKFISASMIEPILEIDHKPQVRWASPVRQSIPQTTAFRLSATDKSTLSMRDAQRADRSVSVSLPDLPSNVPRTQSVSHT
ncbi:unnamed protein product [Adineta ricciae]|uniref:Fibronectin type-III domain-containing protein n=1 Tax=Adineta ricciae TaxID=249248 RepID=A0A814S7B2_ADIRI|nr:unnamed protein product [Adineta ricciae]